MTRVPVAQETDSIGDVLKKFSTESYETGEIVYIVAEKGLLRGMARVADLLRLPATEIIGAAMTPVAATVTPEADQEDVAGIAIRHELAAVPVVNHHGRFLGIVPPRSLIRILRLEHIEDLHRFTGILDGSEQARDAIEAPPFRRAWNRLPWLLVGLLGSIFATFLMSRFERTLQERIAVAFFVPGIVYLADAIGTQTEAITVRGLSFSNGSLRTLFFGELLTGLMIGTVLGAIAFPLVAACFGDAGLAFAVAVSICLAGAFATSIGLLFPWLLSRAGFDPAYGSGPVATIVQDVLSLLVYFIMVVLLLP
jgi:magnesium transporter